MELCKGDRVKVKVGEVVKTGTVMYVRFKGPEYTEVDAVSVRLDDRISDIRYTGTVVSADQVIEYLPITK